MIGIAVSVVVVLAGLVWAWIMYNRVVRARNQVDALWAQVDVQLIRRHELVPNLIESTRGYADHEREAMEAVTEARSDARAVQGPARRARAEESLTRALRTLLAVAERYPELKADQSFGLLQAELATTEDLIATERSQYNDAVKVFNTMIQRFPMNIMAGMMRAVTREYFETSGEPRGPTDVRF